MALKIFSRSFILDIRLSSEYVVSGNYAKAIFSERKLFETFRENNTSMKNRVRCSSVISQRLNLETGVSRRQSTPNFPKYEHFLPPDTHTYVCVLGGKKRSFFKRFGLISFLLKTSVSRFAHLPYYRRVLDFEF